MFRFAPDGSRIEPSLIQGVRVDTELILRYILTVLVLFPAGYVFQRLMRKANPNHPAPPDVKQPPADAIQHDTGIWTKVLIPGKGERSPTVNDRVKVHYTGWRSANGKMFDTTNGVGKTSQVFAVHQLIPGWQHGLQLMVQGEQRRMWIPAELAYGERGKGPRGMLVFDVYMIEILEDDA